MEGHTQPPPEQRRDGQPLQVDLLELALAAKQQAEAAQRDLEALSRYLATMIGRVVGDAS
jgi:hypothetical protein